MFPTKIPLVFQLIPWARSIWANFMAAVPHHLWHLLVMAHKVILACSWCTIRLPPLIWKPCLERLEPIWCERWSSLERQSPSAGRSQRSRAACRRSTKSRGWFATRGRSRLLCAIALWSPTGTASASQTCRTMWRTTCASTSLATRPLASWRRQSIVPPPPPALGTQHQAAPMPDLAVQHPGLEMNRPMLLQPLPGGASNQCRSQLFPLITVSGVMTAPPSVLRLRCLSPALDLREPWLTCQLFWPTIWRGVLP